MPTDISYLHCLV